MERSTVIKQLGEQVAAVVLRACEVPCPHTRSAIIVFEDVLQDEQDLRSLVAHLHRLHDSMDARLVGQRAQLEQFTADLRALAPELDAAPFRSAYSQRRLATSR
ncbi:MAG TPA: hypothetical protein VGE21_04895 [Flavobacteriales bacterium]